MIRYQSFCLPYSVQIQVYRCVAGFLQFHFWYPFLDSRVKNYNIRREVPTHSLIWPETRIRRGCIQWTTTSKYFFAHHRGRPTSESKFGPRRQVTIRLYSYQLLESYTSQLNAASRHLAVVTASPASNDIETGGPTPRALAAALEEVGTSAPLSSNEPY